MLNSRTDFLLEHVKKLSSCVVLFLINLYFCFCFLPLQSVQSEVLQGQVEQEDELLRVKRPEPDLESQKSLSSLPSAAPSRFNGKLVDLGAFSAPVGAQASQNDFDGAAQLARPGQFGNAGDDKFDLGAERGSKELVLAWTRWHHQLSQAIYSRWARLADTAGQATVRMTVNRDRSIQLVMVHSSGNQEFDRTLLQAIFSLNGNPGLTFPAGSQRQQVSLESDYVAGRNIDPGFNWVTDDYEKVKESY